MTDSSGTRSSGGTSKPVWTLKNKGSDGMLHDHFETTRFKKKRTFDILNLAPGTYDLFVGIRRDNMYFEDAWNGPSKKSDEASNSSAASVADHKASVTDHKPSVDDESEDSQSLDVEDESTKNTVLKHVRGGIGAVLSGGRKVISTVTLGKVGMLAINLDVVIIDGDGTEVISTTEQLVCGDRANFELRFTLKDQDSCVKLRVRSLSTIHTMYVFASIFAVQAEEETKIMKMRSSGETQRGSTLSETSKKTPVLEYDRPLQMLRRALLGSRHPQRSAFARALAFACFFSWCGFTIGFTMDSSVTIPLASVTFVAWLVRAIIHTIVIASAE